MKTIFLAILMFLPSLSWSQVKRNIYDLQYLPKAGSFFGSSEASASFGWFRTEDELTESDISESDIRSYGFHQTLGYSPTDQVFVSASMNYSHAKTDYDLKSGGDEEYKFKGESDPSVGIRYRLIELEWIVDLLLNGTISTGNGKSASANREGNNKNGGHSFGGGFQAGKKFEDSQFFLGFNLTKNLDRDRSLVEENGFTQFALEAAYLQQILTTSFLKASGSATYLNEHSIDTGANFSQKAEFRLGIEYQYLVSKEVLLRAGVNYQNNENNRVFTQDSRTEIHKDHLFSLLVGANYGF